MSALPRTASLQQRVMTQEEYASARRAYAADCRPIQCELIALAAGVTRYIDGEAVYAPEAATKRRELLARMDDLQRLHFPLSFCSGCGRVFVNCQCPDD